MKKSLLVVATLMMASMSANASGGTGCYIDTENANNIILSASNLAVSVVGDILKEKGIIVSATPSFKGDADSPLKAFMYSKISAQVVTQDGTPLNVVFQADQHEYAIVSQVSEHDFEGNVTKCDENLQSMKVLAVENALTGYKLLDLDIPVSARTLTVVNSNE